jgi:SAM-dependent methyltransferase
MAAQWYDGLAKIYSLGAISRVKGRQLDWVQPGQRMLVVGAGSGEEVPGLLQGGVELTCLEPSAAMRGRLQSRRGLFIEPRGGLSTEPRGGLSTESRMNLCSDTLLEHCSGEPYDVISANFFFNLYNARELEQAVRHIHDLMKPGGCLWVADFAPYAGHNLKSCLRRAYYRLPHLCFALLGLAQWHPLFDYRQVLSKWGFELEEEQWIPVIPGLPMGFVSLRFRALPLERT